MGFSTKPELAPLVVGGPGSPPRMVGAALSAKGSSLNKWRPGRPLPPKFGGGKDDGSHATTGTPRAARKTKQNKTKQIRPARAKKTMAMLNFSRQPHMGSSWPTGPHVEVGWCIKKKDPKQKRRMALSFFQLLCPEVYWADVHKKIFLSPGLRARLPCMGAPGGVNRAPAGAPRTMGPCAHHPVHRGLRSFALT